MSTAGLMAAGMRDGGQTVGLSLHTCIRGAWGGRAGQPQEPQEQSSSIGLLSHPPLPPLGSLLLTRDTGCPRRDLSGVRPRAAGWPHLAQPAYPIIPTCPGRAPLADLFPVHEMAKARLFCCLLVLTTQSSPELLPLLEGRACSFG